MKKILKNTLLLQMSVLISVVSASAGSTDDIKVRPLHRKILKCVRAQLNQPMTSENYLKVQNMVASIAPNDILNQDLSELEKNIICLQNNE